MTGKIKLELQAGKANPAPPVGPALGSKVCTAAFPPAAPSTARLLCTMSIYLIWSTLRQRRQLQTALVPSAIIHVLLPLWRCAAVYVAPRMAEPDIRLTGTFAIAQGVNIMAFCKEYNAATAKMAGDIIPVEITVYEVSSPCSTLTMIIALSTMMLSTCSMMVNIICSI